MENVNQLVLGCVAKVLRINQMTGAEINIEVSGSVNGIECMGYTKGYHGAEEEIVNGQICRKMDFYPLKNLRCGWVDLSRGSAEDDLRTLLDSLNALEEQLIENGNAKVENMEANNEDHE